MITLKTVPIKNVYNMFVYAFELSKLREYKRLDYERCENIYDLLASLLLSGTQALIKRGLLKNYINQNEERTFLRGKIDVSSSIRRLSFQNASAICDFDEFSANILFNQILKAALLYLSHQPLEKNIKRDISKTLMYFNEIDTIQIKTFKWDILVFNRNNFHYDTLMHFCRLICEDSIANEDKGEKIFKTIDTVLSTLFERFIYGFYKKHRADLYVKHGKLIEWNSNDYSGHDRPPRMKSDIMIVNDTLKLIIDTKFYRETLDKISENLYQIFAYVKNEAAADKNRMLMGMLLYPQVNGKVTRLYMLDGHKFYVQTVDLNQEFSDIKRELLEICGLIFDCQAVNIVPMNALPIAISP
ncbi:MAG: hypothetical protein FWE02_01685 [Defluviitaleaceae bacterium]|nr:hypothetical protein [Defluviitaleaceae bacterium]